MKQAGLPFLVKRAFDVAVASVGLVATAPIVAAAAVAVRATMGTPVLFRQMRPGKDGTPFQLVKFRTMSNAKDDRGRLLGDGARLTAVGAFLRKTSIDELPQLWNVLRGDMSLVGPRPLLMQYLARYSKDEMRRHDVLPGITGYAQVHGRNATTWSDRFAHDLHYVDHWSPWLDASILVQTARVVLRRSGVAQEGHATMPEFMGSNGASTNGAQA